MNVEQLSYRLKINWLLKQTHSLKISLTAIAEKHKTLLSNDGTRKEYHDSEGLLHVPQSPVMQEEFRIPSLVKPSLHMALWWGMRSAIQREQSSLLGSLYCLVNGTFIKEKRKIILVIIIKLQNYIQEERPIIVTSSMRQCH